MLRDLYNRTRNRQTRRAIKQQLRDTFGITDATFYNWLKTGVPAKDQQEVETVLREFSPVEDTEDETKESILVVGKAFQ